MNLEELSQNAEKAASLLKAMSNPNRLIILCLLNGKELSVSEINQELNISQSALSQHLAKLRQDNLVDTRRDAQTIYYSLKGEHTSAIIAALHNIFCEKK